METKKVWLPITTAANETDQIAVSSDSGLNSISLRGQNREGKVKTHTFSSESSLESTMSKFKITGNTQKKNSTTLKRNDAPLSFSKKIAAPARMVVAAKNDVPGFGFEGFQESGTFHALLTSMKRVDESSDSIRKPVSVANNVIREQRKMEDLKEETNIAPLLIKSVGSSSDSDNYELLKLFAPRPVYEIENLRPVRSPSPASSSILNVRSLAKTIVTHSASPPAETMYEFESTKMANTNTAVSADNGYYGNMRPVTLYAARTAPSIPMESSFTAAFDVVDAGKQLEKEVKQPSSKAQPMRYSRIQTSVSPTFGKSQFNDNDMVVGHGTRPNAEVLLHREQFSSVSMAIDEEKVSDTNLRDATLRIEAAKVQGTVRNTGQNPFDVIHRAIKQDTKSMSNNAEQKPMNNIDQPLVSLGSIQTRSSRPDVVGKLYTGFAAKHTPKSIPASNHTPRLTLTPLPNQSLQSESGKAAVPSVSTKVRKIVKKERDGNARKAVVLPAHAPRLVLSGTSNI